MLIVMMALLVTPSRARSLSGGDDPVISRALNAGINAERIELLVIRAQSRGVSPDQLQQILTPVITLAERDLPYHLMMHKVVEGLAKQVSAHEIQLVLEHMQNSMIRSAALVDPWVARQEVQHLIETSRGSRTADEATRHYRNKLLESCAHSLQMHVDDDLLRDFLEEVSSMAIMKNGDVASIAAGLLVLFEMPVTQENPGLGVRLLVGAINAGFSASEIRKLPAALQSAHIHSHLPMEKIAGIMDQQRYDNIPAIHIIENLFQGNVGGSPAGFSAPGLDTYGDGHADRGRGQRPLTPPVP